VIGPAGDPVSSPARDRSRSAREQQVGRTAARERRAHLRVVVEVDAHVQLGPGQAQVRQPRRADRDAPLARVLQQQHARARRQRHQVRAVADGLGRRQRAQIAR
jgi:hypothetical protein